MKLSNKHTRIPLIVLGAIALISTISYVIITNFGFKFDAVLTPTTRAEITADADKLNPLVQEIYSKVDVINTEIGGEDGGKQIQRVYYTQSDANDKSVKETLDGKDGVQYVIAQVSPGFKTNFSYELTNFAILLSVVIVGLNYTLFRNIFDVKYSAVYSLLNIATVLGNITLFVLGLSLLGEYGWHITTFTFNVFIVYVFALMALLSGVSLLFKRFLGDVELESTVGEHFDQFFNKGYKAYALTMVIMLFAISPLLYFYYFRVEILIIILLSILSFSFVKIVYSAVLNWYDQIRIAQKKYNKKQK